MSSFRDFLIWFEGYCENVDGPPSEKQWQRIKDRILALKQAGVSDLTLAPLIAASGAQEPAGGAHTTQWWKEQVLAVLTDNEVLSLDDETARDEMQGIAVDLNAEPKEVALRIVRALTN